MTIPLQPGCQAPIQQELMLACMAVQARMQLQACTMSDPPSNAWLVAQPCRGSMTARSTAGTVINAWNPNPESTLYRGLAKCGVAMLGTAEVRDQHGHCILRSTHCACSELLPQEAPVMMAERCKLTVFFAFSQCACRRERGAGASTSFDPPPAAPRMNSPSPSRGRKPASGARSSKSTTGG